MVCVCLFVCVCVCVCIHALCMYVCIRNTVNEDFIVTVLL